MGKFLDAVVMRRKSNIHLNTSVQYLLYMYFPLSGYYARLSNAGQSIVSLQSKLDHVVIRVKF